MFFQTRYLKDTATFGGTSGLETVELPESGLLAGLEIRVWGTCGSGGDKPDIWLHDRLKKLEVVGGGMKPIKSLTGEQLLAMMLHQRTPIFSHDAKNMSAASCEEVFMINFGRHYHDLEYMLDLSRINDPELQIDTDFTLTSKGGWTNGVAMSAAPSYSVIAHILRDPPMTPRGYIKTSEVARFTGAASKKENMSIPRGPVYSNLYLQSWYKAQGLGYLLDKIELDFNNNAIIPLRVGPIELATEVARMYGIHQIIQQMSVKGGQAYPSPIEQGVLYNARIGLVDAIASALDLWGNSGGLAFRKSSDGVTPVTSNVNVQAVFQGIWPFSVSPIPYFDPWDERTWVNSADLGNFWLRVEGNSSMGTSVVLKLLADEVVTAY